MSNISDYIANSSKIKYATNISRMYCQELGKECIVQKYRYVQTIKTKYMRPIDLYCANIYFSNTETVYGDLCDYSKCFEQLYKIKCKSLTDGLIYNILYNNYGIIKLHKLSCVEVKALIERHVQLINEFNAYYNEVQLINEIEAI